MSGATTCKIGTAISFWLFIAVACASLPKTSLAPSTSTPTSAPTATPPNASFYDRILSSSNATPLPTPLPNELNITPGRDKREQIRLRFGYPWSDEVRNGKLVWTYRTNALPHLRSVVFSPEDIVDEVEFIAPYNSTVADIAAQFGTPEVLGMTPEELPFYYGTPVTAAPYPRQSGQMLLVYPTRGLLFASICTAAYCPSVQSCTGVSKVMGLDTMTYFAPMTVREWLSKPLHPSVCIRPWIGYID